jgi:rfaE bifunctional protein kinase chain/domain
MQDSTTLLAAFKKLRILVLGDVMIDRYLGGTVDRISPEAPVPVVRLQNAENRLGGAANVALNLAALGAKPYLCSVIGQDEAADQLLELLPEAGISNRAVLQSAQRRTTIKTRILAQNQQLLRVDTEDTFDLSESEGKDLLAKVRDILDNQDIDAILFQDYNKGVLSQKTIAEVLLEAVKRDIPTAVDPKAKNFWAYKQITLFKPNLKEIRAQVNFSVQPNVADLSRANDLIRNKLGNQLTLITLSEHGLYVAGAQFGAIYPVPPRDIVDVCGAGDSVISVATLAMALGLEADQIALLSNLAGGQVCEKVGVVPVNAEQLAREFEAVKAISPRS